MAGIPEESDLLVLTRRLRAFAEAREWEQFHTPKNLAMSVAIEAAELMEPMQWLTAEEVESLKDDSPGREELGREIADVAIYLLRLADVMGIDVGDAIARKIDENAERFPVDALREEPAEPRPREGTSSRKFMADFLHEVFDEEFQRRRPYRNMFESSSQLVYFQNFNKEGSSNLWYRLRTSALKSLQESPKEAIVCLTNPAEGFAYTLTIDEIVRKARERGWSGDADLEVNIDNTNGRWRELDWRIESSLVRLAGR